MTHKLNKRDVAFFPKSVQIRPSDRAAFWGFCTRIAARTRLVGEDARGTLTAHDIDKLLVDQNWCCAVSGIQFEPPRGKRQPFGPSIDRIVAGTRYEVGNIRLVCNIVNFAMNEWGEDALWKLAKGMRISAPDRASGGRIAP
jgi:hypothetical protein